MEFATLMNKVAGIRKGQFVKVTYQSELPMNASARKAGVHIYKVTSQVVRLGLNYSNLKAVKEYRAEHGTPDYNNPYTYLTDKVVENKGKTYLNMFTVTHPGTHTKFMLDGKEIQLADHADQVIPSYFGSKSSTSDRKLDMFRVNTDNVLSIG